MHDKGDPPLFDKKSIRNDLILVFLASGIGYWWYYSEAFRPGLYEPLIGSAWGVLIFLIVKGAIWIYKTYTTVETSELLKTESGNEVIELIIVSLRERAKKLAFASRITLVAIFLTLVGGVQVFIYADSIAQQSEFEYRKYQSERLFSKLSESLVTSLQGNDVLQVVIKPDEKIDREKISEISSKAADSIANRLSEDLSKKFSQQFIMELEAIEKAKKGDGVDSSVISALSTRIGSVFMLLFLVQILVSLYRYSTRLAAFYDGRADALQLCKNFDDLNLESLVALTSPDNLDFKAQRPPTDQAIELAKQIISKDK